MASSKKDSAKRRTVNALSSPTTAFVETKTAILEEEKKRSISDAVREKKMLKLPVRPPSKQFTTAFVEGIRNISVAEAMKEAD